MDTLIFVYEKGATEGVVWQPCWIQCDCTFLRARYNISCVEQCEVRQTRVGCLCITLIRQQRFSSIVVPTFVILLTGGEEGGEKDGRGRRGGGGGGRGTHGFTHFSWCIDDASPRWAMYL